MIDDKACERTGVELDDPIAQLKRLLSFRALGQRWSTGHRAINAVSGASHLSRIRCGPVVTPPEYMRSHFAKSEPGLPLSPHLALLLPSESSRGG